MKESSRRPYINFSENGIVYEASSWSLQILAEYIDNFFDTDSVAYGNDIYFDPGGEAEDGSLAFALVFDDTQDPLPQSNTIAQRSISRGSGAWLTARLGKRNVGIVANRLGYQWLAEVARYLRDHLDDINQLDLIVGKDLADDSISFTFLRYKHWQRECERFAE